MKNILFSAKSWKKYEWIEHVAIIDVKYGIHDILYEIIFNERVKTSLMNTNILKV